MVLKMQKLAASKHVADAEVRGFADALTNIDANLQVSCLNAAVRQVKVAQLLSSNYRRYNQSTSSVKRLGRRGLEEGSSMNLQFAKLTFFSPSNLELEWFGRFTPSEHLRILNKVTNTLTVDFPNSLTAFSILERS